MESGALSEKSFPAFSEKVVPLLHITTHIEGRPNDDLLAQMGGRGFPSLRFIDADGNVLGEPSGHSVAEFESTLVAIVNIQELEQRIDAGEEDLEDDLFLAKLRMGVIPFVFAKAKVASLKNLSEEQQAEVAQLIINLEVTSLLGGRKTTEGFQYATQRFLEMMRVETMPIGDVLGDFWYHLHQHAEKQEDIALFAKSLQGMKDVYGVDEGTSGFFDRQDALLKAMRNQAKAAD
ncbi:MAG: hypothetical protein COA70_13730 [Planctomycetota bacterium]|nr:MAG: hypothetical protein COA70_13730 [Planctomycetota bacterium]